MQRRGKTRLVKASEEEEVGGSVVVVVLWGLFMRGQRMGAEVVEQNAVAGPST